MRYAAAAAVTVGALLLAPLACTTTIVPPATPEDPVVVLLLDHGTTPTLVVPGADGGLRRYAYGDWNYYALANNSIADGVAALFWPTQGTLGRTVLSGPADVQRARSESEAVYEIVVSRRAAERLVGRLDREYELQRSTEVLNRLYGMQFVQHPRIYSYFNNSNHAAAGWLEELGCEVRGPAYSSRWRVEAR